MPSWAKPSRVTAGTGVALGLGTLLFKPNSGGNWMGRLFTGLQNYEQYKTPSSLIGYNEGDGSSIFSEAVGQMSQNAPGAIATIGAYGLVAGILAYFGM